MRRGADRLWCVPGARDAATTGSTGAKLAVVSCRTRFSRKGPVGPAIGATADHAPVVDVPLEPDSLKVPADSCFVVQDAPGKGFDSRVLSWVRTEDIISTRLYRLTISNFLRPVE